MNLAIVVLHVFLVGFGVHEASAQTPGQTSVQPPATAPAPAAQAAQPAARELIYQGEATSILGRQVRDPEGRPVGRIVDVLVDDAGLARAAIIDFGGFMGVGNRHIAVAWRALRFTPSADQGTIALDMTQEQIKATPEYRRASRPADAPVAVAAPPPRDADAPTSSPPSPPPLPAAPLNP